MQSSSERVSAVGRVRTLIKRYVARSTYSEADVDAAYKMGVAYGLAKAADLLHVPNAMDTLAQARAECGARLRTGFWGRKD